MEPKDYIVMKIEGEYAYLEAEDGAQLFIALALLPLGCDTGSKLHYENLEFSIIEK